jgi:teichoic acid D-alanine hydrolase
MKKIAILFCLLYAQTAWGQSKQFDEILNYYNSEQNFNGVALVATNGKIDYLKAVGVANRQTGTAINAQSKFKIASITKAFTAVLILQLYEAGKIDLKATFGTYFPTYKGDAKGKVSIENLLTYSSGIPDDGEKVDMQSYQLPIKLDEYIDKYCSSNVTTAPGTVSSYSNVEYIILTKIIENVTKQPFERVLAEKILKPLKMDNTNMLRSKDIIVGLTSSYNIDSTKNIYSDDPYYIENFYGSGAMYSTVEDLLKFDHAIFSYQLMNKTTSELMIAPNKKLGNVAFGVWYASGYGTFSKPFIYRTGGISGACSNWIHTIEDGKSIIVFNNTNGTNLYGMSEQLYLVATGQKAKLPVKNK